MEKTRTRTRAWRRHQARRVFKSRLKYAAVCRNYPAVKWTDLITDKWSKCFKTTGTPCSCWLCCRESFDRRSVKRETVEIIQNELTESTVK